MDIYALRTYNRKYNQFEMMFFLYMTVMLAHYTVPYLKFILFIGCIALTAISMYRKKISKIAAKNILMVAAWYGVFSIWVVLSKKWSYVQRPDSDIPSTMIRILLISICIAYHITSSGKVIKYLDIFVNATTYFIIVYVLSSPVSTWGSTSMGGITHQWRNFAGHIAAVAVIVAYGLYILLKKKRYIVFSMINVMGTVLTGSRAALIAIGVLIVIYLLLDKNITKKTRNICIGVFVLLIVAYILFTNEYLYSIYGSRLEAIFTSSVKDASRDDRAMYKTLGITMFLQKPILGWGMDNFSYYLKYVTGYSQEVYSHCNYVEILSCYGAIGFVVYYLVYLRQFVKLFHFRKDGVLTKICFVVLARFIIFEYATITFSVYTYVFLLTIIFCGINVIIKDHDQKRKFNESE